MQNVALEKNFPFMFIVMTILTKVTILIKVKDLLSPQRHWNRNQQSNNKCKITSHDEPKKTFNDAVHTKITHKKKKLIHKMTCQLFD